MEYIYTHTHKIGKKRRSIIHVVSHFSNIPRPSSANVYSLFVMPTCQVRCKYCTVVSMDVSVLGGVHTIVITIPHVVVSESILYIYTMAEAYHCKSLIGVVML